MNRTLTALLVPVLCLGAVAVAHAQASRPPADLLALPRCVWGKLKVDTRAPLITAMEAHDTAKIDKATGDIRASTLQIAQGCSPSINLDQATGDEVLLDGLRQEAAADLIARDLKITRAQLDRAIAAAPAALTTYLRRVANEMLNRRSPDVLPDFAPIYTALKLPAAGPANANQATWLRTYILAYHEVRVAAELYDPTPKL